MPLVQTVVTDRTKIRELAQQRDGSVVAFARRLGRHPGSITNMKRGKAVSLKFAGQIADALGVGIDAITVPGESANKPDRDEAQADEPDEVAA